MIDVYKCKVVHHKKLIWQNGIDFLVGCSLDYAQRNLADFWRKKPVNFDLI